MGLVIRERMESKSGRDSIVVSFERRVLACLSVQLGKELGRALLVGAVAGILTTSSVRHTQFEGKLEMKIYYLYARNLQILRYYDITVLA